jgi:hypothetical protein
MQDMGMAVMNLFFVFFRVFDVVVVFSKWDVLVPVQIFFDKIADITAFH